MRFGLICLLLAVRPASASTVTLSAAAGPDNYENSGSRYCSQSGETASCSIDYEFWEPLYFRHSAQVMATAEVSFGNLSSWMEMRLDRSVTDADSQAAFYDDLTVVGGAGTGTLVAHYEITSAVSVTWGIGGMRIPAVRPQYLLVQGATTQAYTPDIVESPTGEGYLEENLDVASQFEYGTPFQSGAGVQIPMYYLNGAYVNTLATSADLRLTGFSVLDAAGQEVTGVRILRSSGDPVSGLVPEPGTMSIGLGLVLLGWWRRRCG